MLQSSHDLACCAWSKSRDGGHCKFLLLVVAGSSGYFSQAVKQKTRHIRQTTISFTRALSGRCYGRPREHSVNRVSRLTTNFCGEQARTSLPKAKGPALPAACPIVS